MKIDMMYLKFIMKYIQINSSLDALVVNEEDMQLFSSPITV